MWIAYNCLDKFGLLPSKQTDTEIISRHNTAEATKEALKVWWQQNPYHATFKTLLNILLEQRIGDVATDINFVVTWERRKVVIQYQFAYDFLFFIAEHST